MSTVGLRQRDAMHLLPPWDASEIMIVPNERCHGMEWVLASKIEQNTPRDNVINDEHLKLEEERGISSNSTEQERDQQARN